MSDQATLRLPADAHLSTNFNCLPTLSLCAPAHQNAFSKRLSTLKVINAKINKIDSHAITETKVLIRPKSCC